MRVYYIKKARASKTRRVCHQCRHEVEPGEAYRYITPRFGPEKYWCSAHLPRQSDLVGGKLSEAYAAQEALEDDIDAFRRGTLEDLESSISTAAEEADRIAEEYEESISNMPDSLQDSPTAQECQERADALREWKDELEAVDLGLEEFDSEAAAAQFDRDTFESDEDFKAAIEEEREKFEAEERERVAAEVESACGNLQI